MNAKIYRAIGLMSGTSLDGVDAAWIETDGEHVSAFGPAATLLYDDALRAQLRGLLDRAPGLLPDDPAVLDATARLTREHALAVALLGRSADIVGFHGQTILHAPKAGRTWQIGDAALLSHITRLPVAFDFRAADVAAGGEGAPLVPLFHAALARGLAKPLLIVNIGGVANATWLGASGEIIACDTGPGNGPLDDLAQAHLGTPYDKDGALAAAGQVDHQRLQQLLAHPFFAQPAPKSLDRLSFSSLIAQATQGLAPADAAATLAAFICAAIAETKFPAPPQQVLITGGGRHNATLMAGLAARFAVPVRPVEAVGWNGDALEAQCFGFLAVRTLRGLPLSLPSTTGVRAPQTGGQIYGTIL
ncbi:anhydro-N-acetylmuramic acid kinase [Acidocella facilis]|uniref:anhydro-N-acetylmuramic acid kinase n=1 Tax=Acidocella facilis TaxID=525 RepID=UPI00047A549E|nr:anhydro-N-acetylmuramic acid kinase [Acidocella facilis]